MDSCLSVGRTDKWERKAWPNKVYPNSSRTWLRVQKIGDLSRYVFMLLLSDEYLFG